MSGAGGERLAGPAGGEARGGPHGHRRPTAAAEDAAEAARELERQRGLAAAATAEAEERCRRAAAHAGDPLGPRAQGLWDAAAFHAARARAAATRLAASEALAAAIRARAAAARRAAAEPGGPAAAPAPGERGPCG